MVERAGSNYKNSIWNRNQHITVDDRNLMLYKKELKKLHNKMKDVCYTIMSLRNFFNEKPFAKVQIGISRGKNLHDKRESIKKKETDREIKRFLK